MTTATDPVVQKIIRSFDGLLDYRLGSKFRDTPEFEEIVAQARDGKDWDRDSLNAFLSQRQATP